MLESSRRERYPHGVILQTRKGARYDDRNHRNTWSTLPPPARTVRQRLEAAAPEPPEAETEAAPHACCCRHKVRTPEEHKALLNRLSRIEGQIRGIRGMVEKDVYCADILVQVAAANSALNSFTRELLGQHIRTCVADDLRAGQDEKLDELLKLLPKLMK